MSHLGFQSAPPMRNGNRCYLLSIITVCARLCVWFRCRCVCVCVWSHMLLMGTWTGDNMSKTGEEKQEVCRIPSWAGFARLYHSSKFVLLHFVGFLFDFSVVWLHRRETCQQIVSLSFAVYLRVYVLCRLQITP